MKDDAFSVLSMLVQLEASSSSFPESHEIAEGCQMRQQDVEDILEELASTGHVKLFNTLDSCAASATGKGRRSLKEGVGVIVNAPIARATDKTKVFVVYGRNEAARTAVFTFLRAIGLHPLEWTEVVRATGVPSPYIGQVLKTGFSIAQAIVVIFSPDDEARLRPEYRSANDGSHETEYTGQPRQNVLLEAGMAWGLHEERTVVIEVGKLRPISDLGGRHFVRIDNSANVRKELASRLEAAGCDVRLDGEDWLNPLVSGDFEKCLPNLATTEVIEADDGLIQSRFGTLVSLLELSQAIKDFTVRRFDGKDWRSLAHNTATELRSASAREGLIPQDGSPHLKSLVEICDRIESELRSLTNMSKKKVQAILPEAHEPINKLMSSLLSELNLNGAAGRQLHAQLISTVRELCVKVEPITSENYLFDHEAEIQEDAAHAGKLISLLVSLPLSFHESVNIEAVRKAADELRLIDQVDLTVIDGGAQTRRMAQTIVSAADNLKNQLGL